MLHFQPMIMHLQQLRGVNKETFPAQSNKTSFFAFIVLNEPFYLILYQSHLQPYRQNMCESNFVSYSAAVACLRVQWLLQTGPPALLWPRRGPKKQTVTDGPSHNAFTSTQNSVWVQEYYTNTSTAGKFSFPKSENDFVDFVISHLGLRKSNNTTNQL